LDWEFPTEFTFDFTNDKIPAGITDLYLQVIFRGTLGNEENDAIAVGMKDLNEPMHIVSWNSTDRVYLYGQLYTAQQIRDDPDLLALLPEDFNIDPYDALDTGAAFSPDGNPLYYHNYNWDLPSARYTRVIILTDISPFYIYVSYYSDTPSKDTYFQETIEGVTNQEDSSGNFQNTQVFTFRGKKAHYWYGLFIWYPDGTGVDSAAWPPPASQDPVATNIYP